MRAIRQGLPKDHRRRCARARVCPRRRGSDRRHRPTRGRRHHAECSRVHGSGAPPRPGHAPPEAPIRGIGNGRGAQLRMRQPTRRVRRRGIGVSLISSAIVRARGAGAVVRPRGSGAVTRGRGPGPVTRGRGPGPVTRGRELGAVVRGREPLPSRSRRPHRPGSAHPPGSTCAPPAPAPPRRAPPHSNGERPGTVSSRGVRDEELSARPSPRRSRCPAASRRTDRGAPCRSPRWGDPAPSRGARGTRWRRCPGRR